MVWPLSSIFAFRESLWESRKNNKPWLKFFPSETISEFGPYHRFFFHLKGSTGMTQKQLSVRLERFQKTIKRRVFVMHFRKYLGIGLIVFSASLICWSCYPKRIGPIGPDGKKLAWKEMNKPQRKTHMMKAVMPGAAELFASWRPERFSKADCSLCHGPGFRTDNFKMPTAYLPRLSGDFLLGPELEKHPQTTRLKLDRLVPIMVEALGLKSFSLITRKGFGCYSCHLGPDGPMYGN